MKGDAMQDLIGKDVGQYRILGPRQQQLRSRGVSLERW
jgi:hypothetical protein